MILADTSIWIDHLRHRDGDLVALLDVGQVVTHPMIIGELAVGRVPNRGQVLAELRNLVALPAANDPEVLTFIEARTLHGRGLSLIDVHLLASVLLVSDARLWTRDARLAAMATDLGIAWSPEPHT